MFVHASMVGDSNDDLVDRTEMADAWYDWTMNEFMYRVVDHMTPPDAIWMCANKSCKFTKSSSFSKKYCRCGEYPTEYLQKRLNLVRSSFDLDPLTLKRKKSMQQRRICCWRMSTPNHFAASIILPISWTRSGRKALLM